MRGAVTSTEGNSRGRPEIGPDLRCAPPALVDRPHDERLAAPCVARGEDSRRARRKALAALGAEALERRELRADEAHREEHEVGGAALLRAGDRLERRP